LVGLACLGVPIAVREPEPVVPVPEVETGAEVRTETGDWVRDAGAGGASSLGRRRVTLRGAGRGEARTTTRLLP